MEADVSSEAVTAGAGAGAGGEDELKVESGLPAQWPLFGSPALTTIRVTTCNERFGTIVCGGYCTRANTMYLYTSQCYM